MSAMSRGRPPHRREIIGEPTRLAVQTLHPMLKAAQRLDTICCYQPISEYLAS